MRFSAEWIPGGENASAEERSTLCELGVFIGDREAGQDASEVAERNVSAFYDSDEKREYATICLPAVHLAEGIASNWWRIFGGRDIEHRVLPWRTGFVLPDLRFKFDGHSLNVTCERSEMDNPRVSFLHWGSESLTRSDAESALSTFVSRVVGKLSTDNVAHAEAALAWQRVCESRAEPEEAAFCEAAGALGADPYAIADHDADCVETAARYFDGEALVEFLAGVRQMADAGRAKLLAWVSGRRGRAGSSLPDLAALASQLDAHRIDDEHRLPWERGVRFAKAGRTALDISPEAPTTIKGVSAMLGGARLARSAGPAGIYALVARENDGVHIHLRNRGSAAWARDAEKFAFARALGDAICYPDTRLAPINGLHDAERQAAGRAFAAEFTAPVEAVMAMRRDGKEVENIAGHFGVNAQVVEHQIENAARNLSIAA